MLSIPCIKIPSAESLIMSSLPEGVLVPIPKLPVDPSNVNKVFPPVLNVILPVVEGAFNK
jgi:hypothetical protein